MSKGRLGPAVRTVLADGPVTLEALHRRLVELDAALAVRGPRWLAAQLSRMPDVGRAGDRYHLSDATPDEVAVPAEAPVGRETIDESIAARYVVLDLETNPDRADPADHEIIEVGAVRIEEGVPTANFSRLARNARTLSDTTKQTTGLTERDIADAPDLDQILAELLEFLGDDPVVAHNGFGYDYLVLDAALAARRLTLGNLRLDSLDLAHVCLPRAGDGLISDVDGQRPPPGRDLETLAEWFGTDTEPQHRALEDAKALAEVITSMRAALGGPDTSARLARWLLHEAGHPWAAFLPAEPERPDLVDVVPLPERPKSPPATGTFDPEAAIDPLRPDGALLTGGRAHRTQQVEMAELVCKALAFGRRQLVEAPTGTGKTLAYLLAALAYSRASGQCVVVAAHSKVLQNQILTSLPELEAVHPGVSAVLLKGRENYLSLDALDGLLEQRPADPEEGLALATICRWAARTPTGDWDDLRVWAIESRVPAFGRLRWQLVPDRMPGLAFDALDERCFHRRAFEGLAGADLAILNHAVLLTQDEWLEHTDRLVLDEAHNLEEAATAALSEEVSETELRHLLSTVHSPDSRWGTVGRWLDATGSSVRAEAAQAVLDARRRCAAATDGLTGELVEYVRSRSGARRDEVARFGASYRIRASDARRPDYAPVRRAGAQLARALRDLAAALQGLTVPPDSELRRGYRRRRLESELARVGVAARKAAALVEDVSSCDDDEASLNVADLRLQDGAYGWGLRRVPVTVAPQLERLWQQLEGVVLTSATLMVDGSPSHLIHRLGLGAATARALPTPFDALTERQLLVLPDHLPTPSGMLLDEFADAEADELTRLLTLTGGRGLGLFTSRARMRHVHAHAQPQLDPRGIPLLVQGSAPAPALVERMRTETATSLLATRSFWEGVDIPGEELSLLVVEKLPFDSPGDPVVAARMELLEQQGRDPFGEYLVPQAVIRFAQGVGRLIRSRDDVGAVVVLDKRLRRPTPYRDRFLQALPGPPAIARPQTPEEGYERIASHLGVTWDEETREALRAVEAAGAWADLPELALTDAEIADEAAVLARLDEVRERFGFADWRPGQLDVMRRMLRGEDVMAVLPTGSGKSLTYQLPALLRPELTLVVSPLVALMRDQVRGLKDRGIHQTAALHTGQPQGEQEEILAGARQGRYRLLYVSPERLWSKRFRSALRNLPVARVVVDEAHCVSQWGFTFRPEYAAIVPAVRELAGGSGRRPPIAALTATATPEVQKDLLRVLELDASEAVTRSADRPELRYHVVDCADSRDRDGQVLRVAEAFRGEPVIVYAPIRKHTTRLARLLRAANHRVRAYHGGMAPEERRHTEEAFEEGEVDVVVATKAFGLGVDKPDIAAVVHLEMPASPEEYIQETGRCARGAAHGVGPATGACVLLRMPRDCRVHGTFVKHAAPSPEVVRQVWAAVGDEPWVGPLDDLEAGDDEEQVALAVSYLVEDGALARRDDLTWRGRVWLPSRAREDLDAIADEDAQLAKRGAAVLDAAERLGDELYEAGRWARAASMAPADVEETLLALHRRDVIGFTAFEAAWHLEPVREPDWPAVEASLQQRRRNVRELSKAAKEYRDLRSRCRRDWLLAYLGEGGVGSCGACDVCDPALPRPWEEVELSVDDLAASVPTRLAIVALVDDLETWQFSRRTYEMVLAGRPLQYQGGLVEHPQYGALEHLRPDDLTAAFDKAIDEGLVEEHTVERDTVYTSLRVTEAGRRLLR